MVTVVVEYELDNIPALRGGETVRLDSMRKGSVFVRILRPVFFLAHPHCFIPVQDDVVHINSSPEKWYYLVEFDNGSTGLIDAIPVPEVVEDKEMDVEYLQQQIQELKGRLEEKE